MSKLNKLINTIEEYIVEYFVAILVGLVFLAAALRYLGYPIVWSIDLAQLLFVWIVFFGADLALRNNNHIGVDFFVGYLPVKFRKAVYFIHFVLIAAFLVLVGIYGLDLTISNFSRRFNTLGISYSFATAGVPIGCILMLRTVIEKLIKRDVLMENEDVIDIEVDLDQNTVGEIISE